jgi:hypothetical protein
MQQTYRPPNDLEYATATWEIDPSWNASFSALSSRCLRWIGLDDGYAILRNQPLVDDLDETPVRELMRAAPMSLSIKEFPKPWMRRYGFTLMAWEQSFHLTFLPPDGGGRLAPDGTVVRTDLDGVAFASARIGLMSARLDLGSLSIVSRVAAAPSKLSSRELAATRAMSWRRRIQAEITTASRRSHRSCGPAPA